MFSTWESTTANISTASLSNEFPQFGYIRVGMSTNGVVYYYPFHHWSYEYTKTPRKLLLRSIEHVKEQRLVSRLLEPVVPVELAKLVSRYV